MPQCCYLAKGAKRPSHTTNTVKFDRIPFDPCNSIKGSTSVLSTRKIRPIYSHTFETNLKKFVPRVDTDPALIKLSFTEGTHEGKWSLDLVPFGLKSFCLIQLVTWPTFFKLSSASWPWNDTRVLFFKKPLKPNYSEPSAY